MKKLLALGVAMALVACSPAHHHKGAHHYGKDAHAKNPALTEAMKACHSALEDKKDMATFENCLKEKGFEKPANHPTKVMHKHQNPELSKAMKECHHAVKDKHDVEKFEACLKEKGFEKPANHPKVKAHY